MIFISVFKSRNEVLKIEKVEDRNNSISGTFCLLISDPNIPLSLRHCRRTDFMKPMFNC